MHQPPIILFPPVLLDLNIVHSGLLCYLPGFPVKIIWLCTIRTTDSIRTKSKYAYSIDIKTLVPYIVAHTPSLSGNMVGGFDTPIP